MYRHMSKDEFWRLFHAAWGRDMNNPQYRKDFWKEMQTIAEAEFRIRETLENSIDQIDRLRTRTA